MLLLLLLAGHLIVGVALLAGGRTLERFAHQVAIAPLAALLVAVLSRWPSTDADVVTASVRWVPGLDLLVDVRLDGFAALMLLLVTGVGIAVLAYAPSYFGRSSEGRRVAGLLVLFAGAMAGLVLADHLAWLYVCWELTSVLSFLLIGGQQRTAGQRAAALQALLVTAAGGLTMLAGFIMLAQAAGTWSLTEILAAPPSGTSVGVALGLVLVGAVTKSAQYPFHFWLPGAMVAPTPISTYLHAATMVKAGIYLVARLAPSFASVGIWRPAVITIGLVTMVGAALRALRQHDLKLLLAFGTVSQLGFLFVLAGAGYADTTKALTVLLVAHGLFKGALFLVVGIVDHETGTRDLRSIPALGAGWTGVRITALVSAASMAGIPPVLGFVAKESAYDAFAQRGGIDLLVLAGLVAGSVLTFAYSARFAGPFLRRAGAPRGEHVPAPSFWLPAAALAAITAAAGVGVGPVLDPVVRAGANALDPDVGEPHLSLWHGVNLALVLSVVTLALGTVLALGRGPIERFQSALAPGVEGERSFSRAVQGLNVGARKLTGLLQPGSLPVYVAIILVVVVAVPNVSLLLDGRGPRWDRFSEVAAHPFLAAVLVVTAVGAAVMPRRFGAVLMLGAVGYAMALTFAVQGGTDLALTQFAVETLSIVVFMLVIRQLPRDFRPQPFRAATVLRLAVAGVVAAGTFSLAMATSNGSDDRTVAEEIIASAEPEGGGSNVVNVILVDVRALDTLGEVVVLSVAAVGVVALARVGRRPRAREEVGR